MVWATLATLLASICGICTKKVHDTAFKSADNIIVPPPARTVRKKCGTENREKKPITDTVGKWSCYLLLLFLTLTAMRGGWQYRPLGIIHAGQYATPQYIPLVLNSPFTLIRTIGKETIEERHDFPDLAAAEQFFTPVHQHYEAPTLHTPPVRNVVLVILEGISQEMFKTTTLTF